MASQFLSDFLANLLSTFFGVLFGIPAGMYISHRQEQKAREDRAAEERDRRHKLLTLTRAELAYDLQEIEKRSGYVGNKSIGMHLGPRLKSGLWSALSDGGGLRWIQDLQLMSILS